MKRNVGNRELPFAIPFRKPTLTSLPVYRPQEGRQAIAATGTNYIFKRLS
jgi:hypothetical protein